MNWFDKTLAKLAELEQRIWANRYTQGEDNYWTPVSPTLEEYALLRDDLRNKTNVLHKVPAAVKSISTFEMKFTRGKYEREELYEIATGWTTIDQPNYAV